MNTDFSYCSGVLCKLRAKCKRYLPDPPDLPLWWTEPEYSESTDKCPNFINIET